MAEANPGNQDLRYPIGPFEKDPDITSAKIHFWLEELARLPEILKRATDGLSEEELNTPYRDGGWTIRQVVHHLADSHINGYTRFKWALTEGAPVIRTYEEKDWANLEDAKGAPIVTSILLLKALHERWVLCLESLVPEQWQLTYVHPESGSMALAEALQLYVWHGKHHAAHITSLRERRGW